jgi:hypothetical protein
MASMAVNAPARGVDERPGATSPADAFVAQTDRSASRNVLLAFSRTAVTVRWS